MLNLFVSKSFVRGLVDFFKISNIYVHAPIGADFRPENITYSFVGEKVFVYYKHLPHPITYMNIEQFIVLVLNGNIKGRKNIELIA